MAEKEKGRRDEGGGDLGDVGLGSDEVAELPIHIMRVCDYMCCEVRVGHGMLGWMAL